MGLKLETLQNLLGAKLIDSGVNHGDIWIQIQAENLLTVVEQLRTHPDLKFDGFVDLCGVDYMGRHPRFETVVHLYSMDHGQRLRIRCLVPDESLVVPSLTSFWAGANWHERETYDMYGIRFQGHPNLDRILNPSGTEEFPQRKDFPLRGCREPKEEL